MKTIIHSIQNISERLNTQTSLVNESIGLATVCT